MGGENTRYSADPGGRLLAVREHSGPVRVQEGSNVIGIMEVALAAVAIQKQVKHDQVNGLQPVHVSMYTQTEGKLARCSHEPCSHMRCAISTRVNIQEGLKVCIILPIRYMGQLYTSLYHASPSLRDGWRSALGTWGGGLDVS